MRNPLLYPLCLLYGAAVMARNKLFDWKLLRSVKFSIPVIAVGNLSAGGTGKTPHVEYLVRLLSENFNTVILSRGYKRKTKGFIMANPGSAEEEIGDEPLQYLRKFSKVTVTVCEDRVDGIRKILAQKPDTDVILLDDALQHRYVKPGLSILLTDYHDLYTDDYLLPFGLLREPVSGARRADIIVVTKTPKIFSPLIRRDINEQIKPAEHQHLFYSYVTYDEPVPLSFCKPSIQPLGTNYIVMVTGIANPYPLQEFLSTKCKEVIRVEYPDHHEYRPEDVKKITDIYRNILGSDKVIITTEKDATRLDRPEFAEYFEGIPIFYIPIKIEFHKCDVTRFDKLILQYVEKNRRDTHLPPAGHKT